ncbi:MAG: sulfurtransferase, partial [Gluconacetobacter diazotrophicus]|nr:sulfurtransferase [Gluconacetobacter diazotrophicus]
MHPLVSAAALAVRLPGGAAFDPLLVVLDATAVLPGERFDPARAFADGHVPGARRFDIELFSDPDSELPHTVPGQARFRRLVEALGIGSDSRVVVYDQSGVASAARAWWLFELFGHDAVQVLDGGLPAWRAAGGAVETGEPAPPAAPGRFVPRLRAARLAGLGDVAALSRDGFPGAVMLDARSRARFAATVPEPRPGLPGGHVPGSRSLPFNELLDADKRFLPPEQLRARFAAAGWRPGDRVVTSCGSGLTAAVLSLGLAACGLPA